MKIRVKYYFLFVIVFLSGLYFISCTKPENKVLPDNEYIDVFSEIVIINSNAKITVLERLTKINEVFQKHNTSEKIFRNTVEKFNKDFDGMRVIYRKILERIESKKTGGKQ